jgi:hypothetical protein
MSLHLGTLFWFRANQSLLFLLNAVCLAEKQQIPILVFGLTRLGLEQMFYRTRGKHANHYATDAVFQYLNIFYAHSKEILPQRIIYYIIISPNTIFQLI